MSAAIPDALRALPQGGCWRVEPREEERGR